ncbi:putative ATP-dependent endonuclease of OLD family [Acetivibrio thermocellus AD2]|uniref:ATP-dependent endonuclease of OLD family n=2 Tax=Acetivibrio thermocellus TaxID=1515 RepID=A0AB36TKD7_ACETH|nr:SMC domain protein [Acetivibrio thermocellus DSM 1313]ALX09022.1 hypothetical protein AD2_02032 [Acetivibrio thermocellus AD2]ANV76771.1 SMC domain-containing protein [Acetivibrio thermocellus DSM 2360]EIC05029.1 SMC domain protein [Acetivibrio thermocellus YS]SOD24138.1 Predicted ATP-dependent endonuclease of the OLD family, contains P-loop ATPase and TOPRIM domains [Acetivibrio thermocellus]
MNCMYISKIQIKNFRNFKQFEAHFNNGINVIIGHNNSGKSNLIKALALIFDSNTKKHLEIDDFNKYISLEDLKNEPPKISIAITITQQEDENLMSDDLVTISNWLTKLEEPYEALLTYEFMLPVKEHERYKKKVNNLEKEEEIWEVINRDFLRLYTYKIWGGDPINKTVADSESLQKFDFQFLNAIRDVERDMFTGRNTLLKSVLDFFIDYDIKSDKEKTEDEKLSEISEIKRKFSIDANNLIKSLQKRMEKGKKEILSYAYNIGASFDNSYPNFDGNISDVQLYSALSLIVEYKTGIKIPVSHNGLGYNNLIFMALLLAKMQINSDGTYLGSNAKVFPILVIEEPEAHLHPSMQYQLLKFLNTNIKQNKVRQIFVTTHSTHIAASVSLDQMLCLYKYKNDTQIAYPGKVFPDEKSKKYVQRFLDATKSDMLFSEKVILVEGIAEQLLIPIFARYLECPLEEKHATVINVGGRYFNHFLYLFDENNPFAIKRKVACLTDRDPERKEKSQSRYKKCYPFEFNLQPDTYDYRYNTLLDKYEVRENHKRICQNIASFKQDKNSSTFEYDLILSNPSLDILVTESLKNSEEIKSLMQAYKNGEPLDEFYKLLRNNPENKRIIESIEKANSKEWSEDEKKKAIIASRYLNSVEKGENALELAYVLKENLDKKGTEDFQDFNVPTYIIEAIKWVCQDDDNKF